MGLPRWIPTAIWLVAAAFAMGVVGTAQSLISSGKEEALQQGRHQTERALASAEAAVNRTLLAVDVMLAGVEELMRPVTSAEGDIDAAKAQVLLIGLVKRNLLVRDVTLLGANGETVSGAQLRNVTMPIQNDNESRWPSGFLSQVMAQSTPGLVIGADR